jgi:integrase/recombinase XerD
VPAISGLERHIQRFLDHLEVERGLSTNTLAAYGADLHRFSREMIARHSERVGPEDIVEADVLGYLESLE